MFDRAYSTTQNLLWKNLSANLTHRIEQTLWEQFPVKLSTVPGSMKNWPVWCKISFFFVNGSTT